MSDFAANTLKELEAEVPATRKCLERVPMELSEYKPHEKSMKLGYLAPLVAEVPLWIRYMIETPEIDFATFDHFMPKTTNELVNHFDENVEAARRALTGVTDETLDEDFRLKANGQVVASASRREMIGSCVNHLVHHRGQLTVYMRLNDIPVPALYGPSADDKSGF